MNLICTNANDGKNHYIVFINKTSLPLTIVFTRVPGDKQNSCMGEHKIDPHTDIL